MRWKLDYTATAAEQLSGLDDDPALQLEIHRRLELYAFNPRACRHTDAPLRLMYGQFDVKSSDGRSLAVTAIFRFAQDERSLICMNIRWE